MGLGLTLLIGCSGERSLFAPEHPVAGGGGPSLDATLIGQWETVLLIDVPGDLQTWTTNWIFNADATCRFTRIVRSLAEGTPRVTVRDCRWRSANATVTATYTDNTVSVMPYSFPFLDQQRLLLQGAQYDRIH